jgi:ferric-dicitrate binding protein FerR (iron transport regulator)
VALTACATIDAPLPRGPIPLPSLLPSIEPPSPPQEQCEEVARWEAQDDLAPGATRTFEATWDTLGRVGDFTLCARLQYANPQALRDNDLGCQRVALVAGGTGLGGFFLLP